ncbi:MAG: potassium channel family protein [bacterium]
MYFLIIGCGRLGAELAFKLSDEGHDVVVIDKDNKAFNRLGSSFNGMTITGNGFDCEVLENAGIKQADALAAVTNEDNTNIIAVQIAKQIYQVPNVLARVYDPKKANTYNKLGLEIIGSTTVLARMFRDRFIENNIEKTIAPYHGRIELYNLEVKRPLAGKLVKDLNEPGLFILFMVITKGQMILPLPDYALMEGDKIIGVGTVEGREKIHAMLWE